MPQDKTGRVAQCEDYDSDESRVVEGTVVMASAPAMTAPSATLVIIAPKTNYGTIASGRCNQRLGTIVSRQRTACNHVPYPCCGQHIPTS